jgi:hypothetical protein
MPTGPSRCRRFRRSVAGLASTMALLCAAFASTVARADDGDLLAIPRFDEGVHGLIVDGGIGTSMVGDTLMFELGGQWSAVRSYGRRRWLVQWDGLLAARGGYLANEHPFLFLIGGHELAWAELGRRFVADRDWSPYAGVRLGNEIFLMKHPGLAWSDVDTINSVDRVGGVVATGLVRADVGASLLDALRSLLLVAFVQEELHAAETNTPAQAFLGAGVGARFDLASHHLSASAEASLGVAPERRDSLRGFTDRTARVAASLSARKSFGRGMWISLSTFIARDSDHMVYSATGNVYDTTNAPQFGLSLLYGIAVEQYFPSRRERK